MLDTSNVETIYVRRIGFPVLGYLDPTIATIPSLSTSGNSSQRQRPHLTGSCRVALETITPPQKKTYTNPYTKNGKSW